MNQIHGCFHFKRFLFGTVTIDKNTDPHKYVYTVYDIALHYNGSNNFLFVNATKINQFKANGSEKKIPCVQEIFQRIWNLLT